MPGFLNKIRAFRAAQQGVAAVEFALVVPLMLAVYVGSAEAGTLLTTDRKVQSVAGAIGDLVARSNENISTAQLRDYFRAATAIMTPYDTAGLTQIVTAVSVSSDGEAKVLWSVEYEGGRYIATGSTFPKSTTYNLPQEMIDISKGKTVIAAEARYTYNPIIGMFFDHAIDLKRSNFFLPRFGGSITPS